MKVISYKIFNESEQAVTASEFWEYQKRTGDDLGLKLLGFAKPIVNLIEIEKELGFEVILSTEVGEILLPYESYASDYFVWDTYWIPMDTTYTEPLFNLISLFQIRPAESIKLGRIYNFVAKLRDAGINVVDKANLDSFFLQTSGHIDTDIVLPLYDYQKSGIAWLAQLFDQEIGGLLCDEMGLGKTVQAFGLIGHAKKSGCKNILVVTPASLIFNWSREIDKFIPGLEHYLHFGSERIFHPGQLEKQNIVIVSYDLLTRDVSNFMKIKWDLVICDEAQALKNSDSKRHKCVKELDSQRKYLVTGTPIENSLTDLWSLIDIVRPGLMGSKREFQALLTDDIGDARKLSKFASPIILRRSVLEVAKDLPELVTINERILPTSTFSSFYENARKSAVSEGKNVLSTINQFTQICCYPKLVDQSYHDSQDAKIVRLLDILTNIKNTGEQKAIIFTTFTESLELIRGVVERQLKPNYISIIDGRVAANKRMAIIANFEQVEGFAVLCIQPQAGGTGLNIVGANHVIHFNRQWNPAIEKQATARAYRRGQTRTVFEYLMQYVGTIEEYIADTLDRKMTLASHGNAEPVSEGSNKDIQKALQLTPLFTTIQ
jgi:SNF2 family DNA or RNA helicase